MAVPLLAVLLAAAAALRAEPPALAELRARAGAPAPAVAAPAGAPELPEPGAVSLDAHRHFADWHSWDWDDSFPAERSYDYVDGSMTAARVESSFLLSDAYFEPDGSPRREALDRELSALAAAHPGRLYGLCGINPLWTDVAQRVADCLSLPGMAGLKLNLDYLEEPLAAESVRAGFERMLDAADGRGAVVLVHLHLAGGADAELDELFFAAQRHRGTTFIVAHAAEGAGAALARLGRRLDVLRMENVLTETSTLEQFEPDPSARARRLRAFGVRRVLFGSDEPSFPVARAIESVRALPLTRAEKAAILDGNGRALRARLDALLAARTAIIPPCRETRSPSWSKPATSSTPDAPRRLSRASPEASRPRSAPSGS